ncbi:hypothetical protein GGP86_003208 [Salinibacter ruber]|nr:hypothetical protein [Salinibacter ruber]MCS3863409.1 hypothetical protein [Salinibacter ruber]
MEVAERSVVLSAKGTKPSAANADVLLVLNVDRRKVSFSKIYACFPGAFRFFVFFDFVLSTKLILIAVPADFGTFRFFVCRPVDQHRIVAAPIGEAKYVVVSKFDCGRLPLDLEISLLLIGWAQALVVVVVSFLAPTLETLVEIICYCLSRLAVQPFVALAVHLLGLPLREPVALTAYEPPVPLRHGRPQITRSTRKAV